MTCHGLIKSSNFGVGIELCQVEDGLQDALKMSLPNDLFSEQCLINFGNMLFSLCYTLRQVLLTIFRK